MKLIQSIVLSLALATAANGSQAGLADEKDINSGLLIIAAADKIRRACDTIGARFFVARSYIGQLKDMAQERGYSDEEIDTYINDDREKAKMRERRNAYFQSKGASNLDPQSLCVLGRDEIARDTGIGKLLRAK